MCTPEEVLILGETKFLQLILTQFIYLTTEMLLDLCSRDTQNHREKQAQIIAGVPKAHKIL